MSSAVQGKLRRAAATGGVAALLLAAGACADDESLPLADSGPAPSATATAAPTSTPAGSDAGISNGSGVGAVAVRSAHITSFGWADDDLREPILELIKADKLDNVQLDIKDEDGVIGYASELPLAAEADTIIERFDAEEAIETIHDLGATVTARLVAFRDPRLGRWALENGKMDYLIQNSSGEPYDAGSYGTAAFTNFANEDVIEYNIALAVEAAELGFDSIMYDYIRKPENKGQVYPGIGDRTATEALTDFVAAAAPRIREAGASVGAAVFGISAFAPSSVAQNIPEMAKHLDYVSPMIYPSHWHSGEYAVDSPVNQPHDIVKQSLMDFNRMVLGTDCAVVPWLQNFSWPIEYSASDVAAQIKAAREVGINSFYLWNDSSKVGLGAPALQARDSAGNAPGEIVYSISKPGNYSEGTTDVAKATEVLEAYLAWIDGGLEGSFVNPLDSDSAEGDSAEGDSAEGDSADSDPSPAPDSGSEATPAPTAAES